MASIPAAGGGSPESSTFDVVILGASGFTGKHVIREALKFLSPSSPISSLALAGRSTSRLAAALQWAAAPSSPPTLPLIAADTSDPASLLALARRTRLILSCVGPFRLHGAPVAAACVAAGTDYLDITGETEFMERLAVDLHEKAAEARSLLVSACGFDSVPAELGFLFHSRQWAPPSVPSAVDAYVCLESTKRIVGNFATFESAILGITSADELRALRKKNPLPKPAIPGPPPAKTPFLEYQKTLGLWALKLMSADTAVVRRTLAAWMQHPHGPIGENETTEFTEHRMSFWSSVKSAHFGVKIGFKSILNILFLILIALLIAPLSKFPYGRSLLLKFPEFFTFGLFRKTGPTEEQVRSASFKMWFVGRGFSNETLASQPAAKPDKEIITRVSGPEIGYITTPIVLVQCAIVLLSQRANLPKGGVYTPGFVFGATDLQQRLQENGMSFDLISTKTLRSS